MRFDHEIFHKDNLNLNGTSKSREAVRAIIYENRELIMVYLVENDEYKFPGGGVEANESLSDALIREVREEIGASVHRIGNEIGRVTEYDRQENDIIDYFRMTSHYYEVEIEEIIGFQKLDVYEKKYGFTMRKIDIKAALLANIRAMESNNPITKWIKRETMVLNELLDVYK